MRILVAAADDTLANYLRTAGHKTKTLYVNDLAIRAAREFRADVVLYQTTVPATANHEDTIKELHDNGFRVVLIADPNDQLVIYALVLEIKDLLLFPIDPASILYRVENPATVDEVARLIRKYNLTESEPVGKSRSVKNEKRSRPFSWLKRGVKEQRRDEQGALLSQPALQKTVPGNSCPSREDWGQIIAGTNPASRQDIPEGFKEVVDANPRRLVLVYGPEGGFVAANLAAALTWRGNTVCLVDLSADLRAAARFSVEPQRFDQVKSDPVKAWKKGGRPPELPGLLLIVGTTGIPAEDLTALKADFIVTHTGPAQPQDVSAKARFIQAYRDNGNVVLKTGPGLQEPFTIPLGHLTGTLEKACKRRVPATLMSNEIASAFSNLLAIMEVDEN